MHALTSVVSTPGYGSPLHSGISTLYVFSLEENCFWRVPINEGSDGTYRVAAAITRFTGGSTKYFSTHHVDIPKPKRDPA